MLVLRFRFTASRDVQLVADASEEARDRFSGTDDCFFDVIDSVSSDLVEFVAVGRYVQIIYDVVRMAYQAMKRSHECFSVIVEDGLDSRGDFWQNSF